jgi:hypothetical protein
VCRRTQGPPSRVLSSHFWLVSGAGAATPFLIYIGAFAHIIPKIRAAHQSILPSSIYLRQVAFLAFNIAILAFIVTSLLLIPRHFLTKFATFTFKAASFTLA